MSEGMCPSRKVSMLSAQVLGFEPVQGVVVRRLAETLSTVVARTYNISPTCWYEHIRGWGLVGMAGSPKVGLPQVVYVVQG